MGLVSRSSKELLQIHQTKKKNPKQKKKKKKKVKGQEQAINRKWNSQISHAQEEMLKLISNVRHEKLKLQ